jgi:hypothetical protein
MRIRPKTLRLLFVVFATTLSAQIAPLPSFTLKLETLPSDPLHDLTIFKNPFYLVVKGGEAYLAQNQQVASESEKRKGTIDIVIRNGLDPATRKFKAPILQVAFRYTGSGWAADRFITEIIIPFLLPPERPENRGKVAHSVALVLFADQAVMTGLWEKASQASIRIIGDPMDVRSEQVLRCSVVNSDLMIARY